MRLRRLVLAGGIMSAGACSDDSNPPAAGSYSGEMTGAYTTTFAGEAYFGVMRELGDDGFTLVLGDADPVRVVLQAHGTEQTPAGTWELVPAKSRINRSPVLVIVIRCAWSRGGSTPSCSA